MSGQTDIIYKKPIAFKAAIVYGLLKSQNTPSGSKWSLKEIHTLCKDYYSDRDVDYALEQLTDAELITYSAENGIYSLNPNKRIKEQR